MTSSDGWILPAALAGLTTTAAAAIFLLIPGSGAWQNYTLLPLAALTGGLVGCAVSREVSVATIIAVVIAALPSAALFAAFNKVPQWQAAQEIDTSEIDEMCVRITALRSCYQQKIMGVFDFNDVPERIVTQARDEVAQMPTQQKLTLCDQTFASRINARSDNPTIQISSQAGCVAFALTLAGLPCGIKRRRQISDY